MYFNIFFFLFLKGIVFPSLSRVLTVCVLTTCIVFFVFRAFSFSPLFSFNCMLLPQYIDESRFVTLCVPLHPLKPMEPISSPSFLCF